MQLKNLIGSALLAIVATAAHADTYPSRPIRLLVGFAAGGPTDVVARIYANSVSRTLGQPIVVDNRPGAEAAISGTIAAGAEPDGYTLIFITSPMMSMVPLTQKSVGYDPLTSFTPIGLVNTYANVLLVSNKSPARSVNDLVRLGTRPDGLTYGSAGIGTSNHFGAELFAQLSGTRTVHVPYRGSAQAMMDLVGGKTDFMFDTVGTTIGQVRSGNVRPLAVTSEQRSNFLPDVPTMAEAGLPTYRMTGWLAVAGPAKLPQQVVDKLVKANLALQNDEAFQHNMKQAGYEPRLTGPAELIEHMKQDAALWKEVARKANIRSE